MIPSLFSEASISAIDFTGISSPPQSRRREFLPYMFTTWYSAEVQKQMESGNSTDEIEVDLRISVLKPLHGW